MADNDNTNDNNNDDKDIDTNPPKVVVPPKDDKADTDLINKVVQERLDAELKDIKAKLDSAYAIRDAALKKNAEFEQKEKEENLKRLQDEGKYKEAYDLQLAEERAKREALEKRTIELTRDVAVRDALKSFSFRNDNAANMAYREVISQLVQDTNENWVHRSGVSIKEFVKNFSESEEQAFLFKTKANTGGGTTDNNNTTTTTTKGKSLFKMTQAEVLAMATSGKLPNQT